MDRTEALWTEATGCAHDFLRRFGDAFTRAERDDLVQETACTAWRWADRLRDSGRFGAAVRTIARRKRCRALYEARRHREHLACLRDARDAHCPSYTVAGRRVPFDWLLPVLRAALHRLRDLDRQLLLGIHEGFCCAELAIRFGRTQQSVKARVHRARRRVQREIEAAVLDAADFDTN